MTGETLLSERLGVAQPAVAPDILRSNIESACSRGLHQVPRLAAHDKEMILCGGGPSLKRGLSEIRRRVRAGGKIVAINKASEYLLGEGIPVWGVVLVDPQEVLLDQFAVDGHSAYFVASQCQPAVFDKLAGQMVWLWHTQCDEPELSWVKAFYPDPVLSPHGTTAALRMIGLAYVVGFRTIHIYGLDGSFEVDDKGWLQHHAYVQQEDDVPNVIEIIARDKTSERRFLTRADYARQAGEFMHILEIYHHLWKTGDADRLRVFVHGDGLIPFIWRKRRHELEYRKS